MSIFIVRVMILCNTVCSASSVGAAPVRERIEARRKDIVAGRFKPFAAPLADNLGAVRLSAGELDDRAIRAMNWFVKGVVGAVPRP